MGSAISKTAGVNNVVTRLRLTFLFIFIGTFISAFVGGYLLSDLADNEQNTITYSSSSLDYSLELEHRVADIKTAVEKLHLESTEKGVNELRRFLLEASADINKYINAHPVTETIAQDKVDSFKSRVNELTNAIDVVIPYKLDMTVSDAVIKNNLEEISNVRIAYNDLIEPLTHELFLSLERLDLSTTHQNLEPLKQQLFSQHKLLEISHLMSMLLDNIESVSTESIQISRSTVESRLESNFRAIRQYFPDRSSEISPMIEKLHRLTFGKDGSINSIGLYLANKGKYTEAYANMTKIVSDMDLGVVDMAGSTKTNIEANSTYFNQILERTKRMSLVFAFAVLAAILLVSYFVVERQVNRRIRSLTNAVTDIAKGDTSRVVNVSGSDEVGTIASALEVFKNNARELHRSNSELEQFAYSASHDLKSPLNAIIYLAQSMLEDAEDELSEESSTNLKIIVERAHRLSQMQTDLLEYAQAGKADSSIDELDADGMIAELASLLDPSDQFSITTQYPDEAIMVKITPFRQIVLNLINNAIKHHDKPTGKIHIDMVVDTNRLIVSVIDDGPGIAPEYQDRIFELFEKLESRDTVEGSGLGLSLVKKMVRGSGGRISVYSDPNTRRGTTFTFDWPIVSANPTLKIAA